jgi:hypothetical protein
MYWLLLQAVFAFFMIYVTHPILSSLFAPPPQVYLEMCAPGLSLTHHHTKKYMTKNLKIESCMYIYCTYTV